MSVYSLWPDARTIEESASKEGSVTLCFGGLCGIWGGLFVLSWVSMYFWMDESGRYPG